jgi:hypothetical protein
VKLLESDSGEALDVTFAPEGGAELLETPEVVGRRDIELVKVDRGPGKDVT